MSGNDALGGGANTVPLPLVCLLAGTATVGGISTLGVEVGSERYRFGVVVRRLVAAFEEENWV